MYVDLSVPGVIGPSWWWHKMGTCALYTPQDLPVGCSWNFFRIKSVRFWCFCSPLFQRSTPVRPSISANFWLFKGVYKEKLSAISGIEPETLSADIIATSFEKESCYLHNLGGEATETYSVIAIISYIKYILMEYNLFKLSAISGIEPLTLSADVITQSYYHYLGERPLRYTQ